MKVPRRFESSRLRQLGKDVIIKIESGATSNPTTIETVAKIAKALGVPMEDLVK